MEQLDQWSDLSIPPNIHKAIAELGFKEPTPIQRLAIPAALRDRLDVLGAAPTGSGKTLAFAIPLISHIAQDKETDAERKLRGLILTPTRELAVQIRNHLEAAAKYTDVSVGCVVGGLSSQKQERILNKVKPDILVATPGRLWELMDETQVEHLDLDVVSKIKYLVVDEADRMTEKGHFDELIRLIELMKEQEGCSMKRQILVFSATLTLIHEPPSRLKMKKKKRAHKFTQKQKIRSLIEVLGMREDKTRTIDLTNAGISTPGEQLVESMISCLPEEKDLYLYYFLTLYKGKTIVFCNSKDCLRRLSNVLKILKLSPLSLHASMKQKLRLASLEKFTSKPNGLLIASDVAARGLDIANIDHVIHYQTPRTAEIYIHRSGRTARATNSGVTLMLCEPKEMPILKRLTSTLCRIGRDIATFPIDDATLKAMRTRVKLAQQVDVLEHQRKKKDAKSNWFKNAAKECDIDLSDREDLNDGSDDEKTIENQLKTKAFRKQLDSLLKQPLVSRSCYTAYVTKTGSLNLPLLNSK